MEGGTRMVDQLTRPEATEGPGIEPLIPIAPATFPYLWFSGRQVPWEQATVHVTLVGWPSIGAVFEGIRGYWNAEQAALYIFRLREHMARLEMSMKLQRMLPRFSAAELTAALLDLCRVNDAREDVYIQPLAFTLGSMWGSRAAMGQLPEVFITIRPIESDLLKERSLTAGVSSWTRIHDRALPPRIKAIPNYANSRLGSNEASRHGYDVPIFLNQEGTVAESSGSCIFIVRKGEVVTPPVTASILESITRDSVIELARTALSLPVHEREVDRTELYASDEIFLCGTSMEVTPVTEVDGYQIGAGRSGEITGRIERLFHDVARGIDSRYAHWRTRVE